MASPKLDPSPDTRVDLMLNQDERIQKTIIEEGFSDIKPSPGDTVSVHYAGIYHGGELHGRQFDSSRCRDEPLEFIVGKGEVIEAFALCVATMKLGETCELLVPSAHGFPVGQALKFTIELIDIRGQEVSLESMESVLMTVVDEGQGDLVPLSGAEAKIAYRQLHCRPAETFQTVTYTVGQGFDAGLPVCLDRAVQQMKRGARALVRQYDCTDATVRNPRKTRKVIAMYEIHLISFDETNSARACSKFESEFARALEMKASANDRFKNGDYSVAMSMYKTLDEQLLRIAAVNSENASALCKLRTDVRLNLALTYLKVIRPADCAELCRKVLDTDASNTKAMFRLGQALLLKNKPEEAEHWFKHVLLICPNNTAALEQLRKCTELLTANDRKERQVFSRAFEDLRRV